MTTKTILLVEDEPNDVIFFEHMIKKAAIANPLQITRDGVEALNYLKGTDKFADREIYPLPCLIILDLKLPRATGFEVLKYIREHPVLRRLIAVVLTSSASEEDIAKAYELGANAYLVKPSNSTQLADIVQSIKHFWLTHNHPPPLRGENHPETHESAKRRM